ncbi:MAG: cytochrome c [Sphingobacteriales bacterium]|nr:MAG: cytochrome c [Sphingobacteriales bacterium]
MNALRLAILTISVITSIEATAQKKQKPEYVFPESMPAQIKEQYMSFSDKGYALYQMTCAKCHGGKKVKGKEFIPDFTPEQLEAYQIRITNATHEAELQENNLNAEELALITTFFTYKKKNEISKKEKLKKAAEDSPKNKVAAHNH